MNVKDDCKRLLLEHSINTDSSIDFSVNEELHTMSFEQIIDTYMQASDESQLVFYSALEKSLSMGENGAETFFEGMGKLLLMTHLSDKIEL